MSSERNATQTIDYTLKMQELEQNIELSIFIVSNLGCILESIVRFEKYVFLKSQVALFLSQAILIKYKFCLLATYYGDQRSQHTF